MIPTHNSTMLKTVQNVLGDDHACSVPSEVLLLKQGQSHPTGLTIMYGKRLALAVEPELNRTLAEGLVKSITGGDKIVARRIQEDFWHYEPSHTVWLAANTKPRVKGTDDGIWRRITPVPFTVKFTNPNKELINEFKAEAKGILNWTIQGAHAYIQYPESFVLPKACQEFLDQYRSEEDKLSLFVEDCVDTVQGEKTPNRVVWGVYQAWCAEQSEEEIHKDTFLKMLEERGFPAVKHKHERCRDNFKLKGALAAVYLAKTGGLGKPKVVK
jgi:putative DNA primase/helicase